MLSGVGERDPGSHQVLVFELATQLGEAFDDLREIKTASKTARTWREAAYTRAVESVLQAEAYRGNVARDDAERSE